MITLLISINIFLSIISLMLILSRATNTKRSENINMTGIVPPDIERILAVGEINRQMMHDRLSQMCQRLRDARENQESQQF